MQLFIFVPVPIYSKECELVRILLIRFSEKPSSPNNSYGILSLKVTVVIPLLSGVVAESTV